MNKSVTRRIIAIMFATCGAGTLTYLAITGLESALTSLISMVGIVMGFYFGVKSSQI